jgi:hypothetical protein
MKGIHTGSWGVVGKGYFTVLFHCNFDGRQKLETLTAKKKKKKKTLHGLGPRANYIDRATAACL